jgi:hypothetical protein
MKIELKGDIYLDHAAGENCIVPLSNGNVFSNMERIYHSKLKFRSVGKSAHKKLYLQRMTLDMEDLFSILDMKRVQDSRTKVSMIS